MKHSVVVVGARNAGAATAMLLARQGHDVVMVDRSRMPSDANSTHSLVRGGIVQLDRWGLLDDVLATGAPAIRSVAFHRYDADAPAPLRLDVKSKAGVDMMLAPRRFVLDQLLVEEAVRSGAILLDQTTVTGLTRDWHGRVNGVQIRRTGGDALTIHADFVVGADGVRSRIADLVQAPVLEQHRASGSCFYTYVGGLDWDGFEFHIASDVFAGVFPTNFGEACVWLMQPRRGASGILSAGDRKLEAWLNELDSGAPRLAAKVRSGVIDASLRGAVGLPNHLRRPYGPGWALVGDAGYHRDPITGHGMTDAFRDAELLAVALDRALQHPDSDLEALRIYQRERDAAIAETFRITRALGDFPAPAQFAALQSEFSRALEIEAAELAARPSRRIAAAVRS